MVVLFTFQVFKKNVSKAEAGENVGILLRGIRIETLERGMVLCALGSKELVNRFVIVMFDGNSLGHIMYGFNHEHKIVCTCLCCVVEG